MASTDDPVVTVWSWLAPFRLDGLEHLLDEVERGRRRRYRTRIDADRFAAGAVLLRCAVDGDDPASVRVDRTCAWCGDAHGRPTLPDLDVHASVTHAGDVVMVAVTGLGPVGVDVEPVGPVDPDVVATACAPEERAAIRTDHDVIRTWTRKEAFLKALGTGLRTEPSALVVTAPDRPPGVVTMSGAEPPPCALLDLDAPPDHLASVAVLTGTEPRVLHRPATDLVEPHRVTG